VTAADRQTLEAAAGQALLALRQQRMAAEAVDAQRQAHTAALRTTLLSAVGHDLRTPLTSIKAAIGSLRDPELTLSVAASVLRHGGGSPVAVRASAHGDQVELRVIDCGPGIPPESATSMFIPFQRQGDQDATSGIGLGLSVALHRRDGRHHHRRGRPRRRPDPRDLTARCTHP
jgi:K+-sensing histidine kinase KdpD